MERNKSIDIASGMLILVMVMWHCARVCAFSGNQYYIIFHKLFFFYMTWFYFKSGMFYKKISLRESLYKTSKSLLIPFVTYNIIAEILADVFSMQQFDIILLCHQFLYTGTLESNAPLWFLTSLFVVRNVFVVFDKYRYGKVISLVISLFFATLHHHYCYSIQLPYYLGNIPLGLFFYSIGSLTKDIQNKKSIYYISFLLYISTVLIDRSFFDFRSNDLLGTNYVVFMILCVFSCIFLNNICEIFKCKMLDYVGRNAMDIYCIHWIFICFASAILSVYVKTDYILFFCLFFTVVSASVMYAIIRKAVLRHKTT